MLVKRFSLAVPLINGLKKNQKVFYKMCGLSSCSLLFLKLGSACLHPSAAVFGLYYSLFLVTERKILLLESLSDSERFYERLKLDPC